MRVEVRVEMKGNAAFKLLTVCIFLAFTGFSTQHTRAHPFHTSLTELDWNPHSASWEVGMRVYADDLELAIQKLYPDFILDFQNLSLPLTEQRIQSYIQSRFYLADARSAIGDFNHASRSSKAVTSQSIDGGSKIDSSDAMRQRAIPIRWVGLEPEGTWLWIYFEFSAFKSREGQTLVHRLLMEVNADQINVISVRNGKQRFSAQTHSQLDHFLLKTDSDSMMRSN